MNPCKGCGKVPKIDIVANDNLHVLYVVCECLQFAPIADWNDLNPTTELATAHAQLEACHEFLTAIGTLAESTLDLDGIRNWAAKLLAEQTEENA